MLLFADDIALISNWKWEGPKKKYNQNYGWNIKSTPICEDKGTLNQNTYMWNEK